MITIHTIVRNEEQFVKAALLSALANPAVVRAIVWDTGSSDRTAKEILFIKDSRIEFCQRGEVDRKSLVDLRQEQLSLTKTPWFLLVDGDEVWPRRNLNRLTAAMKKAPRETIALVNHTRNAIGDLQHYLPENKGGYHIGPWKGHLNIRAIRNLSGLSVQGVYPNEWYEFEGRKIQDQVARLVFVDTWYLHLTHLKRSGDWWSEATTLDRLKKHKWLSLLSRTPRLKLTASELPEVLK